jgi:5-methylcytosine-specific restriction enzyme A
MPMRPPRYVPPGTRTAKQINADRMKNDGRTRGRRGQERRAFFLTLHPLCQTCLDQGRATLATQVDHVVPIAQGGPDADPDNWRATCVPCHREKTARERRR